MLLVACGAGANTVDQLAGGATIPAGVTFDADVTIARADVTVTWRVDNRSTMELIVPILVPHKGIAPEGNAYVVPAGGYIEIAERLFGWPDEVEEMAVAPSVGVLRARPGTTESRTIRVPPALGQPARRCDRRTSCPHRYDRAVQDSVHSGPRLVINYPAKRHSSVQALPPFRGRLR